jgi:hypothetical protein
VANNRFVFDGLDELKEALRNMPSELTGEASHDVEGAANGAAAILKSEYHRVSGKLRDGVDVTFTRDQFSTGAIVKSKSPIAWLYDNGSQARHYTTASGAQHATGAMWGKTPPTHVFVRTMIAKRRAMYEALKALLTRHGLLVSGDGE